MLLLDTTPMIAAQELHMFYECSLTTYTISGNDYGEETLSGITVTGIDCGFAYTRTFDKDLGSWLSLGDTATLRLPIATSGINAKSTVEITKKHGTVVSGLLFDIDGEPLVGNTVILLNLKANKV
mgnify:CR=1 FL=1